MTHGVENGEDGGSETQLREVAREVAEDEGWKRERWCGVQGWVVGGCRG